MAKQVDVDILIIGGGLIGAALMLALKDLGYRTVLVEAKPFSPLVHADFDARTLALSPASIRLLTMLQVWPRLATEATAIDAIHVSEQCRFGHAWFRREQKEPLGVVVEMQHISRALHLMLDKDQVIAPAALESLEASTGTAIIEQAGTRTIFRASLVVAADGADSASRNYCGLKATVKSYEQQALVANIGLLRSHDNHAYERFTASGPLALLPMSGLRASLIWALSEVDASSLMVASEADFLKALQQAFGYRLGRFLTVGQRVLYPLRQVVMPQQVCGRVVFVGNAAHTLHPVAGQGFNLGLRDVATLAQCIATQGLGPAMLDRYQDLRRHDQAAILRFTDGLVTLFRSKLPGLAIARGMGLMALDNVSLLKNLLARYTRGFAGIAPDLICGIPLTMEERG